jgi:hypothetical protein
MPERMAVLSLACFLHALGARSAAANPRVKIRRFMLLFLLTGGFEVFRRRFR